jgi:hypothetical protein
MVAMRAAKLFKILNRPSRLTMMTGARRKLAIAHGAQLSAQRLLGDRDPKLLIQPLAEITDPPTHNAMNGWHRATLDHARQRRPMIVLKKRRLSRRLPVDQPGRAKRIELNHPISNDLQRHAADLGRLAAAGTIVNRRQSH